MRKIKYLLVHNFAFKAVSLNSFAESLPTLDDPRPQNSRQRVSILRHPPRLRGSWSWRHEVNSANFSRSEFRRVYFVSSLLTASISLRMANVMSVHKIIHFANDIMIRLKGVFKQGQGGSYYKNNMGVSEGGFKGRRRFMVHGLGYKD